MALLSARMRSLPRVSGETVAQQSEVSSIRFLPLEKALDQLTYEDDRRILRAADRFLAGI